MRQGIMKTLLLILLFTASFAALRGQDVTDLLNVVDQPGLNADDMSGVGSLLPIQDLLSTEENLATESVPNLGGSIPVDGGLSLLLAAGAAYGARRLRRKKDGKPLSEITSGS